MTISHFLNYFFATDGVLPPPHPREDPLLAGRFELKPSDTQLW